MSLKPEQELALLTPQDQAKAFLRLAELHGKPNLAALADYYQTVLEQNSSTEETTARAKPIIYQTAEKRASAAPNRVREDSEPYGAQVRPPAEKLETFYATFDGEVFKPESKIAIEPDKRYRLVLEKSVERFPEIKNRAFREIAKLAVPMGVSDLAEQHDHYLYGTPKRK